MGGYTMDSMDWVILKTIYETKNITKAAKLLFMSQPALTYRLQNLEKEFGRPMFYVEKKHLYFTDTGEMLIHYANEMLKRERELKDMIASSSQEDSGIVRLGTTETYAHFKIAPLLKQFNHHYPNITIMLKAASSQEVLDLLSNGDIHVGICNIGSGNADKKKLIDHDRITIVTKEPLNLTTLPHIPMIKYTQNAVLKEMLNDWWNENYTAPPRINIQVKTLETAMSMVNYGLGYCIVPEMSVDRKYHLHMTYLKNREQQYLIRSCWLRYHTKVLGLPAVRTFVDFLTKYHDTV